MIRLFGEISLTLALAFSFLQSTLPLLGFWRKNPHLLATARPSAWAQFMTVAISYGLLTIAFCVNDFSIGYVAQNSHPDLPLMYRLTAVWGAHEGSILLWILLLNAWTIGFTLFSTKKNAPDFNALVIAILGLINFSFLIFLLLTSNPFVASVSLSSGLDLNPLLQDPGFVIHPPMLYTGYVGFAVAFALTQAALIRGNLDADWAKLTRQYALAAWCFLTFGITLGSWWAYRVLGWGGFWFWDPVENASLLPWVSGTALIHVLLLTEKRGIAKAWSAILAIITFALSLLGTFLVRSGVLISAHTFANDPARGVFLLGLLAILITAALLVYIIRLPMLSSGEPLRFALLSRETALLTNSALLMVAMGTILLGTLYPLILDALHLGTISVGAPYFNKVMAPLVLIIMAFMGFGALCNWQDQTKKNYWQSALKNMVLSFVAAIAILWSVSQHLNVTAAITLTLSFWIVLSIATTFKYLPGMTLAHFGFAVLMIGIMLSSVLSTEREVKMKPGDAATLGPYQFFFIDTQGIRGPNYKAVRGEFEVLKAERHITNLYPEKRIYTVRGMVMTKVDIHPSLFRDLYLALGEPLDAVNWSVRIYYKPFIRFIWFGGLFMIMGGILAITQRRNILPLGKPSL